MDQVLTTAALVALPLLALAAVIDASRRPAWAYTAAHRSKGVTIVGLLLTCWLGALYWWIYLRRIVARAQATTTPPPERPKVDPWAEQP